MQDWCSDCGTSEDLTAEHKTWPAHSLADVDVICRACQNRRAPQRHLIEDEHGRMALSPIADAVGGHES